jgi:hypothetical protein
MVPDIIPMTLPTLQPLPRRSRHSSLGFEVDRDNKTERFLTIFGMVQIRLTNCPQDQSVSS